MGVFDILLFGMAIFLAIYIGGRVLTSQQQSNSRGRTEPFVLTSTMKLGIGLLVLIILALIFNPVVQVEAGHRGVVLEFGAVSDKVLDEGIHFITPIQDSVVQMEVRTQKYSVVASAASKDLQDVTTEVALNFHIQPDRANKIYQNLGTDYTDRVIQPAVQEAVKASTAQFTAEELITKRPLVKEQIDRLLRERFQENGIVVEQTSITDFKFSEQFAKSIEAKVTATQDALRAENDLRRIEVEAQQAKARADGEASAIIAKATAEAEAIKITGEALKQNPQLVQLEAVKKWNGVMPIQVLGTAPLPFINVATTGP